MGLGILITVNNKADEMLTNQVSTVEVYEKIDQPTTYKIRFMVDICNEDIAKSLENNTDPESVLGVLVESQEKLHCLVSGPVSKQEAFLEQGGAGSWLEVEGTDTSQLMDKTPLNLNHTGNDSDIVSGIISPKYVRDPDVDDTPESTHEEDKHALVQKETDLAFVRRLAQRNGFHFWITYDKDGNATGHFKPRNLQGEPVAELLVNRPKYNIENLQIKWDTNRPTQTEGKQIDQNSKEIIKSKVSLDDFDTLGSKGLDAVMKNAGSSMQIAPPSDDGGTMNSRGKAVLMVSFWFINATCKANLNRICKLVRVHTIVNVQGVGSRHSGKYYVTGVRHTIDATAHVMDIEMARNAWGTAESGVTGSKILS